MMQVPELSASRTRSSLCTTHDAWGLNDAHQLAFVPAKDDRDIPDSMPIIWAMDRNELPADYLDYKTYAPACMLSLKGTDKDYANYSVVQYMDRFLRWANIYDITVKYDDSRKGLNPLRKTKYSFPLDADYAKQLEFHMRQHASGPFVRDITFTPCKTDASNGVFSFELWHLCEPTFYKARLEAWRLREYYRRVVAIPRSQPQMSSYASCLRCDVPASRFLQVLAREVRPLRIKAVNTTRADAMMRKLSQDPPARPSSPVTSHFTFRDVLNHIRASRNAAGTSQQASVILQYRRFDAWRVSQFEYKFFGSLYLSKAAKIVRRRFNFNVPPDWPSHLDYYDEFDCFVMRKLVSRQQDIDYYISRCRSNIPYLRNAQLDDLCNNIANSSSKHRLPRWARGLPSLDSVQPQMDSGEGGDAPTSDWTSYMDCGDFAPDQQNTQKKDWLFRIFKALRGMLRELFDTMSEFFSKNPWVHFVLLTVLAALLIKRISHLPNWMVFGLLYFRKTRDVLGITLFQIIKQIYDLRDSAVQQQGPSPWISLAVGLVVMRRFPVAYRIINHRRFVDGLEGILDGTVGAAENLVNLIMSSFTSKRVAWVVRENQEVTAWITDVDKFCDNMMVSGEPDASTTARFYNYWGLGNNYRALYKPEEPMYKRISKALAEMKRVADTFKGFSFPGQLRMEPVGIMLTGEPGVGKSRLAALIAKTLVAAVLNRPDLPSSQLDNYIYQVTSSKFFDGFPCPIVVTFDDFLQQTPAPGDDASEIMNMIRAGNQWPWTLDMAALPNKGRHHFHSSFLLATSNIKDLNFLSKVMTQPQALVRRLPFWFDIKRSDPSVDITPDGDPDDFWLFQRVDPTSKDGSAFKSVGDPIRFSQFISEVMANFYKKNDFFTTTVHSDREIVARMARQVQALRPSNFEQVCPGFQKYLPDNIPSNCATQDQQNHASSIQGSGVQAEGLFGALAAAAAATFVLPKIIVSQVFKSGADTARRECQSLLRAIKQNAFAWAGLSVGLYMLITGLRRLVDWLGGFVFGGSKHQKTVVSNFARSEAGSAKDDVLNRIQHNQFVVGIRAPGGDVCTRCGYGIAMDDQTMVVPHHFLVEARRRKAELVAMSESHILRLVEPKFEDAVRDVAVFHVKTFRPTIWHHVGKPTPGTRCFLLSYDSCKLTTIDRNMSTVYEGTRIERQLITHTASTTVGDCGSLLVSMDTGNQPRLLGFHVAGRISGIGHGFFTPLNHLTSQPQFCGHQFIMKVEPLFNGARQNIEPTDYTDLLAPRSGGPSVLRPKDVDGVRVDPVVKAITSCARQQIEPPEGYETVVRVVVKEIFDMFDKSALRSISDHESAAGVLGDQQIKGVARNKSPGYPLCRQYQNKKPIFGSEGPYDTSNPIAAKAFAMAEALAEAYRNDTLDPSTNCPGAVFRDNLKPEVRSQRKVDAADTRLISGAPLHYVLLVRKHFATFVAQFMLHRHQHGGMIGINPYSGESGHIYNTALAMNKEGVGFAGDFEAFDKNQNYFIMKAMWQAICDNMPNYKDNVAVFDGIGRDTYCAFHLGGDSYRSDTIYRATGSMPSGHPLTSVLNSIYNMIVFRLAWVHKVGLQRVGEFRKNAYLVVYGDDNLCAPVDKHLDFDLEYMNKYCEEKLNMKYTSEVKDGILYKTKPIADCGFIKRKFVKRGQYVFAQLELKSIDDMFNWKLRKTDNITHLQSVTNAALMELAAYPMHVFEERLNKIVQCWERYGISDAVLTCGAKHTYDIYTSMYTQYEPVWSSDIAGDV